MIEYRSGHGRDWTDDLSRNIVAVILMIAFLTLYYGAKFLWAQAKCVFRALKHHRSDPALKRSLRFFLSLLIGGLISGGTATGLHSQIVAGIAAGLLAGSVVMLIFTVIVCNVVDDTYATTFKPEPVPFLKQVLPRQWFPAIAEG